MLTEHRTSNFGSSLKSQSATASLHNKILTRSNSIKSYFLGLFLHRLDRFKFISGDSLQLDVLPKVTWCQSATSSSLKFLEKGTQTACFKYGKNVRISLSPDVPDAVYQSLDVVV